MSDAFIREKTRERSGEDRKRMQWYVIVTMTVLNGTYTENRRDDLNINVEKFFLPFIPCTVQLINCIAICLRPIR